MSHCHRIKGVSLRSIIVDSKPYLKAKGGLYQTRIAQKNKKCHDAELTPG